MSVVVCLGYHGVMTLHPLRRDADSLSERTGTWKGNRSRVCALTAFSTILSGAWLAPLASRVVGPCTWTALE